MADTLVSRMVPIFKTSESAIKQITYGVVYEPNLEYVGGQAVITGKPDTQEDVMTAEEIEKLAHRFLIESQIINEQHEDLEPIGVPVESYIAPIDFAFQLPDGTVKMVKKGSWVLATKWSDDAWEKVLSGDINAYSMEGLGFRREVS